MVKLTTIVYVVVLPCGLVTEPEAPHPLPPSLQDFIDTAVRAFGSLTMSCPGAGTAEPAVVLAAEVAVRGRVDVIVSSPLLRTRQTATYVAHATGAEVEVEDDVAECSFGDWDGHTFPEVMRRWPVELEAWLRARGETYHRAPDAQQDPTELAQTASLNAEIAARNDRAEAQDKADLAAHEAATAKYEAAVSAAASAAATAQANYEADLRAAQAAQAQYERDQADWRRRVAACQAGDRRACAPAG